MGYKDLENLSLYTKVVGYKYYKGFKVTDYMLEFIHCNGSKSFHHRIQTGLNKITSICDVMINSCLHNVNVYIEQDLFNKVLEKSKENNINVNTMFIMCFICGKEGVGFDI